MQNRLSWLDDPKIFEVGTIKAHSDHRWYLTKEEAIKKESSFEQSLNGEWLFHFAENPSKRPKAFYETDFSYDTFDLIQVPAHIELSGYGQIQYINTMYPWEGKHFRRPKYVLENVLSDDFSTATDNTVGSYVKVFELNESLKDKELSIRFDGVETAMYIWLNGHFIGYSEDSFTPTEFDLTDYLIEGKNTLAVQVFKRSTASYLEDQDFFRFSGIFRDVTLVAKPDIHVEDLWIKPELNGDFTQGNLTVETLFNQTPSNIVLTVYSPEDKKLKTIQHQGLTSELRLTIDNPLLWDNQDPNLYKLELEIYNEKGMLQEVIPYSFGFRQIGIKDGVIQLNKKRLIINGVNRHEWNPEKGRAITLADMKADVKIIKKNHINSVRTAHYPNQLPWYQLCDEAGLYLMAEVNLETHGTWQKMGDFEPSYNVPGSVPEWEAATLARATNLFERFKNHTAILFWSLGNESYIGETLAKMNAYFKEKDPSRLVHYEGVYVEREAYEDLVSDVESRMYATPDDVREYLTTNSKKPYILCEYMHDMGNSMGGLNSYMHLLDEFDNYQGGFIWDYIDQALFVEDIVTKRPVLRYGGDFDDKPSDYEFSGNGIVFADRTEKPALQEVSYYYEKYSK